MWTPVFVDGKHVRKSDGRRLYTDGKAYRFIRDGVYRLNDAPAPQGPQYARGQKFVLPDGRAVKIILATRQWVDEHLYRVVTLNREIDWLPESVFNNATLIHESRIYSRLYSTSSGGG